MTPMAFTDHQVVQRSTATAAVVFVADDIAVVDTAGATVTSGRRQVELPVGGPYEIRSRDRVLAANVLVGDLWLLAGQSNMAGAGRLADADTPSPYVNVLDMARRWRNATEPLHTPSESPDAVHSQVGTQHTALDKGLDEPVGAGLGLPFAKGLVRTTGIPVGLVATAHGGTTIADWAPGNRVPDPRTLYGSLLLSAHTAGKRVAGALWFHGESDATHVEDAEASYGPALEAFVEALREDVGSPSFRFLHVQLGRYVYDAPDDVVARWSALREIQRTFPGADGMTTAIDLELDDAVHTSTPELKRLGRRLARLATGEARTLTLGRATVAGRSAIPTGDRLTVRLEFDGVSGALRAPGRVNGFSIRDSSGCPLPRVYGAEIDPTDAAAVLVHVSPVPEADAELWYGWGTDPSCNLVDAADGAVPAFGPIALRSLGR